MRKNMTLPEKNQRLIDSYLKINNEGRDVLDMVLQKLRKIRGESETAKFLENTKTVLPERRGYI